MPAVSHKVLIIDDERPLARALELKLKASGFDVQVVTDGQMGLDLLIQTDYDLVLLDLIMPKMDGFKILEELHSKGKKTKVIVLSNLSQTEDMQRVKALGAADYFVKANTSLVTIVERVTKILGDT